MEITKDLLANLREFQQKKHYGSKAEAMFVDGMFNPKNWNGGDGIIRQYFSKFYGKVNNDIFASEVFFNWNGIEVDGEIIVSHKYFEDQNYVTIVLHTYHYVEEDILRDWHDDIAYLSWYKNRGTTDVMKFNGKEMSEEEYLLVLNALKASGFDFDLTP